VAECQLPKLDVAGSNPVGRSNSTGPHGTPREALRVSGHQMITTRQIEAFFDAGVQEVRLVFDEPTADVLPKALRAVAPG
jgi:hypothetical protein